MIAQIAAAVKEYLTKWLNEREEKEGLCPSLNICYSISSKTFL